jgi:hypothetical protein
MMALIDDRPEQPVDENLFETSVEISSGARISGGYRLLERLPEDRWWIERRVEHTEGGVRREVVDRYALHARTIPTIRRLAEEAGFEHLETRCSETGERVAPDQRWVSDCLFVLRKRGASR